MKPIVIDDRATRELHRAMGWYDRKCFGVGAKLNRQVRLAIEKIQQVPLQGVRYKQTNYRFRRVKRYPYIVFYVERPEIIVVVAIQHGRRRIRLPRGL